MTDVLHIERTFAAPPDRVWHAWTTPDGLATWWWTHLTGTTYDVDLRVGGAYRIEAKGAGFGVTGEVLELDPPRRLVLSWSWLDDGVPGPVERVELTLTDTGGATRLDLRHTGPWTTPQPADDYLTGWTAVLDALAAVLAEESASAQRRV